MYHNTQMALLLISIIPKSKGTSIKKGYTEQIYLRESGSKVFYVIPPQYSLRYCLKDRAMAAFGH
jgi:hypothetical protein